MRVDGTLVGLPRVGLSQSSELVQHIGARAPLTRIQPPFAIREGGEWGWSERYPVLPARLPAVSRLCPGRNPANEPSLPYSPAANRQ